MSKKTETKTYDEARFGVVRYPNYYVVIDKSDLNHKIVYQSRNREAAHRKASSLNRET